MKTLKTIIIALILTTGFSYASNAQTRFHVSVNTPGVHVSAGNYHRGYNRPVVYRESYRPVYRRAYHAEPVVYHSYYRRPVYHANYRHVVYRPVYHRGHGRW